MAIRHYYVKLPQAAAVLFLPRGESASKHSVRKPGPAQPGPARPRHVQEGQQGVPGGRTDDADDGHGAGHGGCAAAAAPVLLFWFPSHLDTHSVPRHIRRFI